MGKIRLKWLDNALDTVPVPTTWTRSRLSGLQFIALQANRALTTHIPNVITQIPQWPEMHILNVNMHHLEDLEWSYSEAGQRCSNDSGTMVAAKFQIKQYH